MRLVVRDDEVLVAGSLIVELIEEAEHAVHHPPAKSAPAPGKKRPSEAQGATAAPAQQPAVPGSSGPPLTEVHPPEQHPEVLPEKAPEVALWSAAASYKKGDMVSFESATDIGAYQALKANKGSQPDQNCGAPDSEADWTLVQSFPKGK